MFTMMCPPKAANVVGAVEMAAANHLFSAVGSSSFDGQQQQQHQQQQQQQQQQQIQLQHEQQYLPCRQLQSQEQQLQYIPPASPSVIVPRQAHEQKDVVLQQLQHLQQIQQLQQQVGLPVTADASDACDVDPVGALDLRIVKASESVSLFDAKDVLGDASAVDEDISGPDRRREEQHKELRLQTSPYAASASQWRSRRSLTTAATATSETATFEQNGYPSYAPAQFAHPAGGPQYLAAHLRSPDPRLPSPVERLSPSPPPGFTSSSSTAAGKRRPPPLSSPPPLVPLDAAASANPYQQSPPQMILQHPRNPNFDDFRLTAIKEEAPSSPPAVPSAMSPSSPSGSAYHQRLFQRSLMMPNSPPSPYRNHALLDQKYSSPGSVAQSPASVTPSPSPGPSSFTYLQHVLRHTRGRNEPVQDQKEEPVEPEEEEEEEQALPIDEMDRRLKCFDEDLERGRQHRLRPDSYPTSPQSPLNFPAVAALQRGQVHLSPPDAASSTLSPPSPPKLVPAEQLHRLLYSEQRRRDEETQHQREERVVPRPFSVESRIISATSNRGGLGGILGHAKGKRGRPRKHAPKIPLPPLYVFIRNMLHSDAYNPKIISWVSDSLGVFKVNNTAEFARTWGKMKSNRSEEMNYEKMSRAMRYHYGNEKQGRRGHLAMVKEKRLVYRFGELAVNWRRSEVLRSTCEIHDLCKRCLCLWTKE